MEQGFIDILKKVVDKHGKEYFLETKKCKAIVSDYTGSEYRIERGLLLRAVEEGVSNALLAAEKDDIDRCMKAQQSKLQEEQFMDSVMAWSVVIVLANVLRDVIVKEVKTDIKSGLGKFDEATSLFYDEQYNKAVPIFESLAKENHAGAQTCLGEAYEYGWGVEKDNAKAVEWYRKAADQGYAQAQSELGRCYNLGHGVPKDIAKGTEWLRKAADQGYPPSQFELGRCYYWGDRGIKADHAKAFEWFSKAAEQGNNMAQSMLGKCYEKGEGVKKDYGKAAEWYRKSDFYGEVSEAYVKKLEEKAQNKTIASRELNKIIASSDLDGKFKEAQDIYSKAVTLYGEDKYDEANEELEKAYAIFESLAQSNYTGAIFMLGQYYYDGLLSRQDYAKAVEWYHKAADNGHTEAMEALYMCYHHGRGVPKDEAKANEWFDKAMASKKTKKPADKKSSETANNAKEASDLNYKGLKAYGRGDYKKAFNLFSQAAELGNHDAQYSLGIFYSQGLSVPQDQAKAAEWYSKAAEQGHAEAKKKLNDLKKKGVVAAGGKKELEKAIAFIKECIYGDTDESDHEEECENAVAVIENFAVKGNAEAQEYLGDCYTYRIGVERDYKKALEWYQKAADQGNLDAQVSIGHAYKEGRGVPKDRDKAMAIFKDAADKGNVGAKRQIFMAENGIL